VELELEFTIPSSDDIFPAASPDNLKQLLKEQICKKKAQLKSHFKNNQTQENIIKMLDYINTYYMNDISLKDGAEALNIHPNYVCTLFKTQLNNSFLNCLHPKRIAEAKTMLMNEPNLSIAEISCKSGYTSPNQFYWCIYMKKAPFLGIIGLSQSQRSQKKGANPMITQNTTFENSENQFAIAFKELKLGKLLNKSGIRKAQGASAYSVFQFPLLLVFQGKNLFRFLSSKHKEETCSKNTYYRFLNKSKYNWRKFLYLLTATVTGYFNTSLSDAEIIRIYGNRWSIEIFFKASKSLMKLENEFQGRSYDMMINHITIVFTRYIILE